MRFAFRLILAKCLQSISHYTVADEMSRIE